MPIIDALLLCHVSWVIGIESGPKKIDPSQRYEAEKLAQYRWDIRYILISFAWIGFHKTNFGAKKNLI